jgi:four helix bundle protein
VSQTLRCRKPAHLISARTPQGRDLALSGRMKQPSVARKRTLALHDRALRFSHAINLSCPKQFSDIPSCVVWSQLIRAGDSTSSNLIEADAASRDADFLNNMRIACREAKEAQTSLTKIRMAGLDHFQQVVDRDLESEAGQLASIFAAIILNMRLRLEEEAKRHGQYRVRFLAATSVSSSLTRKNSSSGGE